MSDLLDDQKRLLSFSALTQKYEVKTTFIDYYGLTHALGPLRTRILAFGQRKPNQALNWYDSLKNITNASLHNIIVKSKFLPPNTQDGMLSQGFKALDLPKLYRCPFDTTKEVKLVMFQFKISHNIVYTKDKLMKAKMSTSNKCYLSKLSKHTLQHMLVDCSFVQSCWRCLHT